MIILYPDQINSMQRGIISGIYIYINIIYRGYDDDDDDDDDEEAS